jgi:hypothetical protein
MRTEGSRAEEGGSNAGGSGARMAAAAPHRQPTSSAPTALPMRATLPQQADPRLVSAQQAVASAWAPTYTRKDMMPLVRGPTPVTLTEARTVPVVPFALPREASRREATKMNLRCLMTRLGITTVRWCAPPSSSSPTRRRTVRLCTIARGEVRRTVGICGCVVGGCVRRPHPGRQRGWVSCPA